METRIFYSFSIDHTWFLHIANKRMHNRVCILMNFHNNRNNVREKIDPEK